MRSVEDQQSAGYRGSGRAAAGTGRDLRSAGFAVRRGGDDRAAAARIRSGRHRRLRGSQRRRRTGGHRSPTTSEAPGDQPIVTLPVVGRGGGGVAATRSGCSRARPSASTPARRCRRSPTRCCPLRLHRRRPGRRFKIYKPVRSPAITSAASATTCSPVMWRSAPEPSSGPRRWVCSPQWDATRCWCTRGRGCRSSRSAASSSTSTARPVAGRSTTSTPMRLAAAARDAGADVNRVGIVAADADRLREVVEGQLIRSESS